MASKTLTLFDINPNRWENYRTTVHEDSLRALAKSLKEQQLDALLVSEEPGSDKYGLIAGFCRFEAMSRNALQELVVEYNEQMKLMPNDEGFVISTGDVNNGFRTASPHHPDWSCRQMRETIRNATPNWRERYDNCLKAYPVKVEIYTGVTEGEAAMKNWASNTFRTNPSLWDNICAIVKFKSLGVAQKKLAEAYQLSQPAVSQYITVHSFPENVRKLYAEIEDQKVQAMVETCLQEWRRRISIHDKGDDRAFALKFSVARELSGIAKNAVGGEPLNLTAFINLMQIALCITESGVTRPTSVLPDFSLIKPRIEDLARMSSAQAVAASTAIVSPAIPKPVDAPAAPAIETPVANEPATVSPVIATTPPVAVKSSIDQEREVAASVAVEAPSFLDEEDEVLGQDSLMDSLEPEPVAMADLLTDDNLGKTRTAMTEAAHASVSITAESLSSKAGRCLSLAKSAQKASLENPVESVTAYTQLALAETMLSMAKSSLAKAVQDQAAKEYEVCENMISLLMEVFKSHSSDTQRMRLITILERK